MILANLSQFRKSKGIARSIGLSVAILGVALMACGTVETETNSLFLAAATVTRPTSVTSVVSSTPPLTTAPTRATASATPIISSTPSIIFTPTPIALKDWKQRWLKGIPCRAPCWENITPGKTTLQEAIKLLEANPAVRPGSIAVIPKPEGTNVPERGSLSWKWIDDNIQLSIIRFNYENTQIVLEIGLNAFEFKLGDIIQAYGEPTHVIADKQMGIPNLGIVWFSQGIGVGLIPNKGEPILDSSLIVRFSKFFIPTTPQKYVKEGGVLGAEQFIPWQGYKDFKFYCTASMPSHRCEP